MNQKLLNKIKSDSEKLRNLCTIIGKAGGENAAHIGGALSCIDFFSCVDNIYDYSSRPERTQSLILSKGHACLSLYSLIVKSKFIGIDQVVNTFEKDASAFLGHPCRNKEIGISFSTGSLGNGLAHAAGKALFRLNNSSSQLKNLPVTCVVGDGECNEGIVWETFEFISKNNINNLIIFIDCNGWQQTQKSIYSEDSYSSFEKRLNCYNFNTHVIDGHDHQKICEALQSDLKKPKLIIGKTIKGKGYDLFENNNDWHHGVITQPIFDELIKK